MNPAIFRQYDIRGVVDVDLTVDAAEKLGQAFGTYAQRHDALTVSVSRDNRRHGQKLKSAFIGGLLTTGCQVIDIGVLPTPVNYFAHFELPTDASVQITGSHNPAEFNGFKMNLNQAAVYGNAIQELRRIIETDVFLIRNDGILTDREVLSDYHHMMVSKIKLDRPLKVVLDGGNGTAGLIAPQIIKSLGCDVIELYCEPDGTYPNHHPDPTVAENLTDLIATVKEVGADAGIAYDGDSDRIGVVNEKGDILWGDQLLALFAREVLQDGPAPILFEVKCSVALIDDIKKHGGEPVMYKTGHSLIKKKMKEIGSPLAGEMSGHIFIKHDYYGFDDAIYASARLLRIMSRTDQPLSALLADLPRYPSTPEIRSDCPDEIKFSVVDELKVHFQAKYEVIDVDGMRIVFDDGSWALVRASNTQPVLVSRFEARSEQRLGEIRLEVENELQRVMKEFEK